MAGYVYTLPNDFRPVPDEFSGTITGVQAQAKQNTTASIRRPLRGTERKEDSYASIRIVNSSGNVKKGIRNSSERANDQFKGYYNFLLQAYAEQRMEKSQVIETFGQSYVYFYGERTPVVQFQGILLDTQDFNWKAEFLHNYDNHFRGTKLVAGKYRAFVKVKDDLFGGYLMDMSVNTSTENPDQVGFTFNLLVTDRALLNIISRNSGISDSEGSSEIQVPPLPTYNVPPPRNEKGGFLAGIRALRDGVTSAIDESIGFLRTISSGRRIRVPDADINAAGDFQIATRTVTLDNGTINRTALLRGEKVKIQSRAIIGYDHIGSGDVTQNMDEYINPSMNMPVGIVDTVNSTPADTSKALRKFLKKNGVAAYKVDGLPVEALLIGRVSYGILNVALTQKTLS